jgi:hypothetical protein
MARIDPDATLQIMTTLAPRAGALSSEVALPSAQLRAVLVRHEPEHFILLEAPEEAEFALELVVNDPLIAVQNHGGPWGTILELRTEPPAAYMVTGFDLDYGTLQCRKVERIPEPASSSSD